MFKKLTIGVLMAVISLSFAGCAEIKPDSSKDKMYSTMYPDSAIEYRTYLGKQITNCCNILTTHMALIQNLDKSAYELTITQAEKDRQTVADMLDEIKVTMSADDAETDRETLIKALTLCIEHFDGYIDGLYNKKDVSEYKSKFQNDFIALSGLDIFYTQ